jgi:hypothetical protein
MCHGGKLLDGLGAAHAVYLLSTNVTDKFIFDQPVTSQAVVARPLAARPVSMPLPFDESVTSQAGVAVCHWLNNRWHHRRAL